LFIINNLKNKVMNPLMGSQEYNSIGGGGFGGLGGGIGTFGLFGLLGLGGKNGVLGGNDDGCDRTAAQTAVLAAAITNAKDATVDETRAIDKAICETKERVSDFAHAATLQAFQTAQSAQAQATAFQAANDAKFENLSREGERNTAVILAKLNQTELQDLRDQLAQSHRHSDRQGVDISIANSNAQTQGQVQAQFQAQNDSLGKWFHSFENQLNRNSSDVINLGTMVASGNQANQQTNIK
jgi:hypothetical protein